jgi:hypothetical protein
MKRKGMWADFTLEEIELMLSIRIEEEERAEKAPRKAARAGRAAEPPTAGSAPDHGERRGIGAAFSDDDLELLRILWLRMQKRAPEATPSSPASKRVSKPTAAEPAPDRRTVSRKKKTGDAS